MVQNLTVIHKPIPPTQSDIRKARAAARQLSSLVKQGKSVRLVANVHPEVAADIPSSAASLLMKVLSAMAAGHQMELIATDLELTTQQAANYLGVSRPFLIKQIKNGLLPCRKVGSHRRIQLLDLQRYQSKMNAARQKTLDKLAAEGQKLGLGY